MATKGEITGFEIKDCGSVKVRESHDGHTVEHEYWCVPKKIALKLLNASKPPTVSEFDHWIHEHDEQEKKRHSAEVYSYGWWSNND